MAGQKDGGGTFSLQDKGLRGEPGEENHHAWEGERADLTAAGENHPAMWVERESGLGGGVGCPISNRAAKIKYRFRRC